MIISKVSRYKIYCDMDDVITDFQGTVFDISGKTVFELKSDGGDGTLWKYINSAGLEFWSQMRWTKNGKKLWDLISPYNVTILSAYTKEGEYTVQGKKIWMKENLGEVDYILCLREEKQRYANEKSVLIDDRDTNIDEWVKSGGIGILYQDSNFGKLRDKIKSYMD